jgi:hypothetical protein
MLTMGWCTAEASTKFALQTELRARLPACGLELHPTKTKIVYSRDGNRKATYPNVKFDFRGYLFSAPSGGSPRPATQCVKKVVTRVAGMLTATSIPSAPRLVSSITFNVRKTRPL